MPRDGIGERIDTAFRSPSEALFFAVRQNRTTLLFLSRINGRLIHVRVFIGHLLQTPRRRSSPTSGREACSASISSRAKTTAGLGRKKSPEAGVLRQNTHPVPPLYAASDGCFKASIRPRQGPKRPEKGVRTLKKEEKNRLLKKDADRPSLANASSSRRSGRDANKRDEFRASVLRQDSAPLIFARLPKLSIFV